MQPLVANSDWHRTSFFVVVGVLALPQLYGTLKLRPGRGADVRDRGSYRALQATVLAGVALGYWTATRFGSATIGAGREAAFVIGLVLMLIGAAGTAATIVLLGASFTVEVAVQSGQRVVETGPYRWVRHPSYATQLLSLFGLGLVLTNWASLAILMICSGAGYGYRIAVEERALCDALGEPYRVYMLRTRRVIPFVV